MTASNTYGRQVVLVLTNKSGGGVIAGDVVIVDTSNNDAFTTTTSANYTGLVGVAQETIANNGTGRILISGYAALVNVNASVTRGHFGATFTVAKQATDAAASRQAGTFCQFLTGGTTPDANVFNPDLGGAALTNPMTTTGDIIYSSDNSGTPARRGIGAATTVLHGGTTPSYAAVTGADLNPDNILPWHISIVPMIWTPDATAGTGTWGNNTTNSQQTFPFYGPGSVANSGFAVGWVNASPAQNDAFSYNLVLAAGTWDCNIWVRKTTSFGIVTLNQDGSSMGTMDLYAAAEAAAKLSITGFTVSATGKHVMQFIMATKNASSSGYQATFFGIEFRRTA